MSEGMINKIISQLYISLASIFYFWIQLIGESMALQHNFFLYKQRFTIG